MCVFMCVCVYVCLCEIVCVCVARRDVCMCGLTCHVIVPHQSQQQGDNSPSPRLCLSPSVEQVILQREGIQFG